MNIESFELGLAETNAFLIWKDGSGDAILIDAPHGAWKEITPFLKKNGLHLKALILTHGHWDHIADSKNFQDAGIPIYAHKGDKAWIEDPSPMNAMLPSELHFKGVKVDHIVNHGDKLNFLGTDFEVRHVPGHAPGNILLYVANDRVAFSGDVIFSGSVGRYDLPGGDPSILKQSIKTQIYSLPEDTVLYVGHGPSTTVKNEKQTNPFIRG
jgi:hydroxyacylglutathione hydrolase